MDAYDNRSELHSYGKSQGHGQFSSDLVLVTAMLFDLNITVTHADYEPDDEGGTAGGGQAIDPEFYDTAVVDDQDMDDIITRMMDARVTRGGGGTAPASAAAIARLKKRKVDEGMLDANGKAYCTVCTDDVSISESVTELPCKHWFHEACIIEWLSSHGNCPHCRENISPDEEEEASLPSRKGKEPAGPTESVGYGSQPEVGHYPRQNDPFDGYRDEMLARSIYMAERPSIHDDEAFARSLQEEHNFAVHDDEALARRLYEESRPSLEDDEALARRLYEESQPSVHDDADMARRMHDESEALARKLQEENDLAVRDDEAMARRLQEENDRETGYGPYQSSGSNCGPVPASHFSQNAIEGRGRPTQWDGHGSRDHGPPSGSRFSPVDEDGFASPDNEGSGYGRSGNFGPNDYGGDHNRSYRRGGYPPPGQDDGFDPSRGE